MFKKHNVLLADIFLILGIITYFASGNVLDNLIGSKLNWSKWQNLCRKLIRREFTSKHQVEFESASGITTDFCGKLYSNNGHWHGKIWRVLQL